MPANGKRVKVLDKTIDILLLFLEKEEALGITQISKELKIAKSSVHRILNTLKSRGFINQHPVTSKYWIGSRVFSLGMLYQNNFKLHEIAHQYMKKLSDEFAEAVHLGIFDELSYSQVIVVDKVEPNQRLSFSPMTGSVNPTHASALGKALLAYSTDDIRETVLSLPRDEFTRNTITDREKLQEELEKIRKQGYSVDNEELELGLVCFAVPIIAESKKETVASISISGPKERIKKRKSKIIKKLQATAVMVGREFG